MDLSKESMIGFICNRFKSYKPLLELDLSRSNMRPGQLCNLMECLAAEYSETGGSGAGSQKLRSLNISYTAYLCATTRRPIDARADGEDQE